MNFSTNISFNSVKNINKPCKYIDVVRDKTNVIHNKLFNTAMKRLMADIKNYGSVRKLFDNDFDFNNINDFILSVRELPDNLYWKPSDVIIIFRTFKNDKPILTKLKFDLSEYWNSSYTDYERSAKKVLFDKNVENDFEVVKYDYIRGKAIIESRLNDITYEVDFDELNENDKRSNEMSLPDNLFIRQINF